MPAIPPSLSLIVGVAAVVVALVGPLYYLVLDIRERLGRHGEKRSQLSDEQDDLDSDIQDIHDDIDQLREDVNEIAVRSEYNQKHIHDLLLSHDEDEDGPLSHSGTSGKQCPLGDECPWHSNSPG